MDFPFAVVEVYKSRETVLHVTLFTNRSLTVELGEVAEWEVTAAVLAVEILAVEGLVACELGSTCIRWSNPLSYLKMAIGLTQTDAGVSSYFVLERYFSCNTTCLWSLICSEPHLDVLGSGWRPLYSYGLYFFSSSSSPSLILRALL